MILFQLVQPVFRPEKYLRICESDLILQSNFQSLEVVSRGSETQLQVTENLNRIAQISWG